jgi:glycosyltransferase involved in cell wall biosynthesis
MSSTTPLVSISCITYNQGKYLRQCLDGFLSQERDFDIEILLHDDASTDETPQIIQEYTTRYPDIIFPVIQKENQYSKGVRGMMPRFNFPRARGKYIALCEGDDWWLDTRKLQKQVDALESNPEYVLCFHPVVIMNESGVPEGKDTITIPQLYETLENLAEFGNYIHTPTVMFRNVIQDYPVHSIERFTHW